MRERPFIAAYMMANQPHGTLYIGVTSNLPQRVQQHRENLLEGFTSRYGLKRLVWHEPHDFMAGAIRRQKTLKHYVRDWKINLIERKNPCWNDLHPELVGDPSVARY